MNLAALEGLAASETLAADDLPAFHDRAVLARHQHPNWHSVILFDAAGQPLLHTGLPFGSAAGRREPRLHPTGTETRQPVVSDLIIGPVTGKPGITHVVPVQRGGELRYMLAAVIRPEAWSTCWPSSAPSPEPSSPPLTAPDASLPATATTPLCRAGGAGLVRGRPEHGAGGPRPGTCLEGYEVAGAHASRRTGWTVFVGVPTAVSTRPVRRTLWASGGLAGLLCLIALVLGRPWPGASPAPWTR